MDFCFPKMSYKRQEMQLYFLIGLMIQAQLAAAQTCTDSNENLDNQTCGDLVTEDTKFVCYNAELEATCCASCEALAGDIPGCKYGDNTTCFDFLCPTLVNLADCCETCFTGTITAMTTPTTTATPAMTTGSAITSTPPITSPPAITTTSAISTTSTITGSNTASIIPSTSTPSTMTSSVFVNTPTTTATPAMPTVSTITSTPPITSTPAITTTSAISTTSTITSSNTASIIPSTSTPSTMTSSVFVNTPSTISPLGCVWPFVEFSDSCYFFGSVELTYELARIGCDVFDKPGVESNLVQVDSEEELKFLKEIMNKRLIQPLFGYWNDLFEVSHGEEKWRSSGDPLIVSDWETGEPNDLLVQQSCTMFLRKNDYRQGDVECRNSINKREVDARSAFKLCELKFHDPTSGHRGPSPGFVKYMCN